MNAYSPFVRRVRALRAVRGALAGLAVGGGVAGLGSALVAIGALDVSAGTLLLAVGLTAFVGALAGAFWPVPVEALARSIDRRAALQDRLSSSREVLGDGEFASALREDAARALACVRACDAYPLRFRWGWSLTVLPALLAAAIYLAGNTTLFLSPEQRADRLAQRRQAEEIRRVVTPLAKQALDPEAPDEKRLVEALEKLRLDLERGRVPRNEALQRAHEISEQSRELGRRRAEQALATISEAEDAMTRLALDRLARETPRMTPEEALALTGMGRDQRDALRAMDPTDARAESRALSGQMEEVQRQISDARAQAAKTEQLMKGLGPNSPRSQELEALLRRQRDRLEGLERELESLRKALAKIELSQDVHEMMRKLNEHPEMAKLREMAAKLAEDAERAKKGQQPKLTPKDIQAMIDSLDKWAAALERLADELKDPEAMKQYIEKLREALKRQGSCNGLGLLSGQLPSLFGAPSPGPGPGGAEDVMFRDTQQVNHNASSKPGEGETKPQQLSGQRREAGADDYVEVRGPASLGQRAQTPYGRVPNSYRRRAEQAIERNQIPKQHEKRVREYFESLGGKR